MTAGDKENPRNGGREKMLKAYIREVLAEMSTRYKRETGANMPRWRERLMQYADNGEYYVHFSFFPKLGLNPLNKYDTPTGFYTYPLEREKISRFATERPYAIVVTLNNSGNFLRFNEYSEEDLERDIERLRDEYGLTREMEDAGRQEARVKNPGGILWNITRLLANSRKEEKRKTKNPAWAGQREQYFEDLSWIAQTLAGKTGRARQVAIDKFLEGSRDGRLKQAARERWKRLYILAKDMPEDRTPKEIDRQAEEQKQFTENPRAGDWTSILRRLGYEGAIDDGEKIIHPLEPFQSVFFSSQALEPVDIINKEERTDIGDLALQEKPSSEKNMKGYAFMAEEFTGYMAKALGAPEVAQYEFSDCAFRNADFSGISINASKFVNCTFTDCNLNGARLNACLFSSCIIKNPVGGDLSTLSLGGSYVEGLKVLPHDTLMPKGFKIQDSSGQVVKA